MARLSTNVHIQSLRYPSWCLSRLLDTKIGTKEIVSLRRKYSTMYYYVDNAHTPFKQLHSGSNGEGFNFSSSDLDIMMIDNNTVVLESIHGTRLFDSRKTILLMKREGCNPGFVILKLLHHGNDLAIKESLVEYYGNSVVSSLLYRDVHTQAEYGQVGHGPCNTFQGTTGDETDMAYCFECDTWPTEAKEFIYRQRLFGWPEKSLLDKIICRGCHLVPIGDKNHDLSHIQWRLSFSAAEKDLVHSFNHTQFLVYGLLKIFLKQFLNKFHISDGVLCSYFLKTAMFFSIESTPSSFWRDSLLIPCFWFCLNKLITWVKQGYCPNYFVPQNNMFRNKVFGQHRHNLLWVLNQGKRIGWTCIYLCEDLKVLRGIVSHSVSHNSSVLIPSDKKIEFLLDKTAKEFIVNPRYFNGEKLNKVLANSFTLFSHFRTQQEKDLSTLLFYYVLRSIGLSGFCIDGSTNNKNKYKTLIKCQRLFMTSSEGLGCEGFFYMATFYYKTGQYENAICVLERALSIWKPYRLYHSVSHGSLYNSDLYQRYLCCRGISLNDKIKLGFSEDILIHERDKTFYPVELFHDIETTAPYFLCIPPMPYTVFLLFLCYHKLGNIDRSLSMLWNLEVLTHDNTQGGRRYPVVFNMLAICVDKLGIKDYAVEICLLSKELKPGEKWS